MVIDAQTLKRTTGKTCAMLYAWLRYHGFDEKVVDLVVVGEDDSVQVREMVRAESGDGVLGVCDPEGAVIAPQRRIVDVRVLSPFPDVVREACR